MDRILLTIIIPFYNQEELIGKSLQLVPDTASLQLVLINDCSTDNSLCVAESHLSLFRLAQIDLISLTNNSGVSEARNRGLDVANGDYICFIDGDDMLDGILPIVNWLKGVQASDELLYQLPYRTTIANSSVYQNYQAKNISCSFRARSLDFIDGVDRGRDATTVWAKLFKRSLIEQYGIRFNPEMRTWEDYFFLLDLACATGLDLIINAHLGLYTHTLSRPGESLTSTAEIPKSMLCTFEEHLMLLHGQDILDGRILPGLRRRIRFLLNDLILVHEIRYCSSLHTSAKKIILVFKHLLSSYLMLLPIDIGQLFIFIRRGRPALAACRYLRMPHGFAIIGTFKSCRKRNG